MGWNSHAYSCTISSFRQKTDSAISKNNSSVRPGFILRKKLILIFCSATQKLYKLSILFLLLTNYSFAYFLSIYLFYLSMYLFILIVVVLLGRPIFNSTVFFSLEVTEQATRARNSSQ